MEEIAWWNEKLQRKDLPWEYFRYFFFTKQPAFNFVGNEMVPDLELNTQEVTSLTDLLDKFIFGGSPSALSTTFRKNDKPFSICDALSNRIKYACSDCGANSFLCSECFHNSEHVNHKYRIAHPSFEEYCMCGFQQFWKGNDHCCALHVVTEESDSFPNDTLEKSRLVFQAVLNFSFEVSVQKFVFDMDVEDDIYCVEYAYDRLCEDSMPEVYEALRNCKFNPNDAHKLLVDFESKGRMIIKCDSLPQCDVLKTELDQHFRDSISDYITGKVVTIPASQIAVQYFASKLLSWMEEYLKYADFRKIFCQVMIKIEESGVSMLEKIVKSEYSLYTQPREHFQKLVKLGMMADVQGRIALAQVFIRNYSTVTKLFIGEGIQIHRQNFIYGFTQLLFSFSEVAHYLIANENALSIISNSWKTKILKDQEEIYDNVQEREHCDRNFNALLSTIPIEWTTQLREGFLRGLFCFLDYLQYGQHFLTQSTPIDINQQGFHLSCMTNMALLNMTILKWCGSDKTVLIVVYRATLIGLQKIVPYKKKQIYQVAGYRGAFIPPDDVANLTSGVIPLTKFFSNLNLLLEKFNLHFNGPEFQVTKPSIAEIIQPVLKAKSLVAEIYDNQEFTNLIALGKVPEHDLQLLQFGASLMDSDEFLMNLLIWFKLINWTNTSEELENRREDVPVAENVLKLIINVIGEREFLEITKDTYHEDIAKKLIIHIFLSPNYLLYGSGSFTSLTFYCILSRYIPVSSEIVNNVTNELTEFDESMVDGYRLKDQFYNEFDPFYYRYSTQESRDVYLKELQRRKAANTNCCSALNLPKLSKSYSNIVNLLQCDIMQHIMETILRRCTKWNTNYVSGYLLHEVLQLIGYALQEEQTGYYPSFQFTERSKQWNLVNYLENLLTNPNVELYHDLLKWTLKKYREIASFPIEEAVVIPPSNLSEENDREDRSAKVAEIRAKLLKQMTVIQSKFLQDNEEQFFPVPENSEDTHTCILCHECHTLDEEKQVLVSPAFIKKSVVFCHNRYNYPNFKSTKNFIPSIRNCTHVAHLNCWKSYAARREQNLLQDDEFRCPLCKFLGNSLLPIVPSSFKFDFSGCRMSFTYWLLSFNVENNIEDSQNKLNDDLIEAIHDFQIRYNEVSGVKEELMWESLAYAVHITEVRLRYTNKPLLGDLSNINKNSLKDLVRFSSILKNINTSVTPTSIVLENSPLAWDSTDLLINLTLSMQQNSNSSFGSHIIHLVLLVHFVKILIVTDFDTLGIPEKIKLDDSKTPLTEILNFLSKPTKSLNEDAIWTHLQEACLPFLRCAALFYQFLTDVPQPSHLTILGGDTFSNLCSYLGLPQTRHKIFGSQGVLRVIKTWCQHPQVITFINHRRPNFGQVIPKFTKWIIKLPDDYNELIKATSKYICPSYNRLKGNFPLLCLTCGAWICNKRVCCKKELNGCLQNSYNVHAAQCTNGVGIFLQILYRKIFMVIPFCQELTYLSINEFPYADSAENLYLGHFPLQLSPKKYEGLKTLWINHLLKNC